MMLMGLWVGPGYPNMHQYLTPVVQQLCQLEQGVQIVNEHQQKISV
jgi:hypothetical protein